MLKANCVLILVLMDNVNTKPSPDWHTPMKPVLILVLMDNVNTKKYRPLDGANKS